MKHRLRMAGSFYGHNVGDKKKKSRTPLRKTSESLLRSCRVSVNREEKRTEGAGFLAWIFMGPSTFLHSGWIDVYLFVLANGTRRGILSIVIKGGKFVIVGAKCFSCNSDEMSN